MASVKQVSPVNLGSQQFRNEKAQPLKKNLVQLNASSPNLLANFLDLMAIAQSCPGIFAVNMSIFIGYKLRGVKGSIVCALGTILPSFLIILAVALFFQEFRDNETVQRIFMGIRPAVVALIAAPTFKMAKSAKITFTNVWIPVVSAFLIWLLGVSPIYVIIVAGLGGYLYGKYIKPTEN